MKYLFALLIACALVGCNQPSVTSDGYDVVILNGRVMDPETNFDGVRNVGIKDGIIVTITEDEISGAETIDATGHVIAPGFIDTHTHAMDPMTNKMYLRDGVTSAMDLEYGSLQVDKFYEDRKGNSMVNYGTGVSHEYARMAALDNIIPDECTNVYTWRGKSAEDGVMGWSAINPDDEQKTIIYDWLKKGMQDGALTVCSTVGYYQKTCDTREMWEIQKIADSFDRAFSCHPRFGPFEPLPTPYPLGYQEVMSNAAMLGQPILLSHNNNQGWDVIVEMVEEGRKNGMIVWAEQYPYIAGGPNAGNEIIAPDNLKKMGFSVEEVIYDPVIGRFLTEEEFVELIKTNPAKNLVGFIRPKDWPEKWVATPNLTIAADPLPMFDEEGNWLPVDFPYEKWQGHPRAAGTRGKCFRIARENGVDLMLVLNNASYFSAKMLGTAGIEFFDKRGRMQEGMVADITIFDPGTITDNSTYNVGENGLPTTGIPYVLVNGEIAVRDSRVDLDVKAGQPIRYEPVEGKDYSYLMTANVSNNQNSRIDRKNLLAFGISSYASLHDCALHPQNLVK